MRILIVLLITFSFLGGAYHFFYGDSIFDQQSAYQLLLISAVLFTCDTITTRLNKLSRQLSDISNHYG